MGRYFFQLFSYVFFYFQSVYKLVNDFFINFIIPSCQVF